MPAAAPVAIAAGALVAGPGQYCGYAVRETAGAVAKVRLWDGTSAAGLLLASIGLAANASSDVFHGTDGIRFAAGLFVEIVTGAVEGSVFLG